MGSMNLAKMMRSMFGATSSRVYVAGPTSHLQRCFWKSAKEKEADKACQMAKEETESIKEQATQVKEASQSIKDMASSTTNAVKNMTKDVKQEVFRTADVVVDKMKEPIQGAVSHAWDKASKNIEDKVAEKIKDRVVNKEEQAKEQGKNAP